MTIRVTIFQGLYGEIANLFAGCVKLINANCITISCLHNTLLS